MALFSTAAERRAARRAARRSRRTANRAGRRSTRSSRREKRRAEGVFGGRKRRTERRTGRQTRRATAREERLAARQARVEARALRRAERSGAILEGLGTVADAAAPIVQAALAGGATGAAEALGYAPMDAYGTDYSEEGFADLDAYMAGDDYGEEALDLYGEEGVEDPAAELGAEEPLDAVDPDAPSEEVTVYGDTGGNGNLWLLGAAAAALLLTRKKGKGKKGRKKAA